MREVISDQKARQAPKGRPVLMVLIGSFVLLGIYMLSLMFWSSSTSPDSPSQDAARETTTGSPSASANPSDRVPSQNPAYPAPDASATTGSTPPPKQ